MLNMTIQDKLAKAKTNADKIIVIMKSDYQVNNEQRSEMILKAAEIYDLIEELQGDLANRTPRI